MNYSKNEIEEIVRIGMEELEKRKKIIHVSKNKVFKTNRARMVREDGSIVFRFTICQSHLKVDYLKYSFWTKSGVYVISKNQLMNFLSTETPSASGYNLTMRIKEGKAYLSYHNKTSARLLPRLPQMSIKFDIKK